MRKIIQLFILVPIMALCTGCFELVEQVTIKEGNSGTYKLIGNFSQSKGTLQGLMTKDSVMGARIPSISEINTNIQKVKDKFASMPGISNVTIKKDYSSFIFEMSCDFTTVKALDEALVNTLSAFSKNQNQIASGNYAMSGKVFKRQIVYDYTREVAKNMNSQFQGILEKATFLAIYRFPNTIKSISNSKASISANRKATMLKVSLLDISKSKAAIANTVVLE